MRAFIKRPLAWGLACLIAVVVIIVAVNVVGANPSAKSSATSSSTPSPTASANANTSKLDIDAIAKALGVKTISADAECKLDANGLVSYQVGALQNVPSPRKWSDALSTPIVSTDSTAARKELQQAICQDPLLGVTWAHFFAHMSFGTVNVSSLNEWLKPYVADASVINSQAAGFIPLLNVDHPTKKQAEDAVGKNQDYQELAGYVNTLFDRFSVESDIQSLPSVLNYHLKNGGVEVATLPAVEINSPQESLPALVFGLTIKGACVPVSQFGANTGDKRPEAFKAPSCAPPTTTTPRCTSNCGNTVPKCTSNCVPTTPKCTVPTECLTPKQHKDDVTPPQGTVPQGPDAPQPTQPAQKPTNGATNGTVGSDTGSGVPVGGASSGGTPTTPAPIDPNGGTPTTPAPTPIGDPG